MFTSSCEDPLTNLNSEENNILNEIKKDCKCDARFEKDSEALNGLKKYGNFWIILNLNSIDKDFCKKDNLNEFEIKAIKYAKLLMQLNDSVHKEYKVMFYSSEYPNPTLEIPLCEVIYTFNKDSL